MIFNRQNQLPATLANSQRNEAEVPGCCTIILRADQGTFDILPTMHCKSVKMEDI